MKSNIDLTELIEIIEPIVESFSAELVDVELKGRPGNQILRIFVDVEGGITLDLCERISREISDLLDRKDPIPGRYRLEVSSPGIDRPLKNWKDFRRNVNRKVRLSFFDNTDNEQTLEGIIKTAEEKIVYIEEQGRLIAVPMNKLKTAKIVPIL